MGSTDLIYLILLFLFMLRKHNPILNIVNGVIIDLPTPANITIIWNWGSLLGLTLIIQLVSGVLLATRFTAISEYSFERVVVIFQESNYGWLLRLLHSTGARFFFLFLYLHIGRGLYYGSYQKKEVWNIGLVIYLILMGTAFLGYVLPWGQMSYWAATVITNLLSAIPYVGGIIVEWVWGGFAVGSPTLVRFFALHYLLPFVVTALVILHIFFLHSEGRRNPIGVRRNTYKVAFHYSYRVKDSLYFFLYIWLLVIFSLTLGYSFIDAENFIPANPLVTPAHIQPEWYFLFAYAILRSIPNKLGGVVGLLLAILVFFVYPFVTSTTAGGMVFSPMGRVVFWGIVVAFLLLTWLGIIPAEPPFVIVSILITSIYFGLIFLSWLIIYLAL